MKPDCYQCKHRGVVPGDTHSCCQYPGNETDIFKFLSRANVQNTLKLQIRAHPHGIRKGWFMWPVNFDPVWLENCEGFVAKEIAK